MIAKMAQELRQKGALCAVMTGSGSAVFGVYDSFEYATVACTMLRDKYSQVYLATSV